MNISPRIQQRVNLGRHIPNRTRLSAPVYCPLEDGRALITLPFVVYGEEQVKRQKPGYFVAADGDVTRSLLAGLQPEATVFAREPCQGLFYAWADSNRTTVLGVTSSGRQMWRQRLRGPGCARRGNGGPLVIGSAASELRRVDRTGTMLHDLDRVFGVRPFAGPHGVDCVQSHTYLADPDVTHSIWGIDTMGNPVTRIGSDDPDLNRSKQGILSYPFDLCVLADGRLAVAENGRSRIALFDDSGDCCGIVEAKDLDVDEICSSRLFTSDDRSEIVLFARLDREVWLLRWTP